MSTEAYMKLSGLGRGTSSQLRCDDIPCPVVSDEDRARARQVVALRVPKEDLFEVLGQLGLV